MWSNFFGLRGSHFDSSEWQYFICILSKYSNNKLSPLSGDVASVFWPKVCCMCVGILVYFNKKVGVLCFTPFISSKEVIIKHRLFIWKWWHHLLPETLKVQAFHTHLLTLLCIKTSQTVGTSSCTSHSHNSVWMSAKRVGVKMFNPNVQIFCDLTSADVDGMVILTNRVDLWFLTKLY